MPNYGIGKIYKLVNSVDGKICIGSTCQTLAKRKGEHKRYATKYVNRKVYQHLNSIGWENVRIVLIENYACGSRDELRAREEYYIDLLKPSLNMRESSATSSLGIGLCVHKKEQSQCGACNAGKYYCDTCEISFCSKAVLKTHTGRMTHKKKYVKVFKETFGSEMSLADVPAF
jgi:group I intron endonuclease